MTSQSHSFYVKTKVSVIPFQSSQHHISYNRYAPKHLTGILPDMEKYATLLLDLGQLIAKHLETIISIVAFVISCISLHISLKDRKNFVKIELFKGREYLNQKKIDYSKDPHLIPRFYVIVRNTGRTNIYVRTAWLSVNGEEFKLKDPKTIPHGGALGFPYIPGEDPDRPLEPYTERLYELYYENLKDNDRLSKLDEFKVKAFVQLQSGKKANTGKAIKIKSSEIFNDLP